MGQTGFTDCVNSSGSQRIIKKPESCFNFLVGVDFIVMEKKVAGSFRKVKLSAPLLLLFQHSLCNHNKIQFKIIFCIIDVQAGFFLHPV